MTLVILDQSFTRTCHSGLYLPRWVNWNGGAFTCPELLLWVWLIILRGLFINLQFLLVDFPPAPISTLCTPRFPQAYVAAPLNSWINDKLSTIYWNGGLNDCSPAQSQRICKCHVLSGACHFFRTFCINHQNRPYDESHVDFFHLLPLLFIFFFFVLNKSTEMIWNCAPSKLCLQRQTGVVQVNHYMKTKYNEQCPVIKNPGSVILWSSALP